MVIEDSVSFFWLCRLVILAELYSLPDALAWLTTQHYSAVTHPCCGQSTALQVKHSAENFLQATQHTL